jgi:hypothetical protein
MSEPRESYNVQTATLPVSVRLISGDVEAAIALHLARLTQSGKTFTLTIVYDPHTGRYALYDGKPAGML